MKTLTLLRHAKAVTPGGVEDHQRALAPRGHVDAAAVGRATRAPELVLCSTALRTRQTLDDVAAGWSARPGVRYEPSLYLATAATLLRRVEAFDEAVSSIWLIGHNPGLHDLALQLAGPGGVTEFPMLGDRFPTACRAVFQAEAESWPEFIRGPLLVELALAAA